jgi:hypothetical protein
MFDSKKLKGSDHIIRSEANTFDRKANMFDSKKIIFEAKQTRLMVGIFFFQRDVNTLDRKEI